MSLLSLPFVFSAAHVSKWEALPEDTESRIELEKWSWVAAHGGSSESENDAESLKPNEIMFSMDENHERRGVATRDHPTNSNPRSTRPFRYLSLVSALCL